MGVQFNKLTGEIGLFGSSVTGSAIAALVVSGETPTPATNGVQTVFTVANAYVAGSLKVTRASFRMHPTADFTETSSTTFTMVVAPDTGEPLIVDYIKS